MASRSGGPSAGLVALDAHEPAHLAQRHAALASEYLRELGRTQEALARAKVALDQAREDQDDARALLLVQCSHALREMNRRKEARAAAETAHRSSDIPRRSTLCACSIPRSAARNTSLSACSCAARGLSEAPRPGLLHDLSRRRACAGTRSRARALSSPSRSVPLAVEEFEVIDGDADAPPGIYGMSGLSFFPDDERG